jgi:hypothetical protein
MSFLYPSLLWALLLVSIPVIIHLFHFRIYKLVYFSNLKFLSTIKDASESRSKIKNLIILLLRIIAVCALVIAFANPYVPLNNKKNIAKESIVCIYLDNSFSMNSGSSYGNVFDASKERIRAILSSYQPTRKFIFITNDFEPRHRFICSKDQILSFLEQTQISPEFKHISEIKEYTRNFLDQEFSSIAYHCVFYIVSDFQKIVFDFEKIKSDSAFMHHLIPMATNKVNNIFIDSCWFSSAGRKYNQTEELMVRIVNRGEESFSDIPLKLFINGKQKAVSNFHIDQNQQIELALNYSNSETGLLACYLEIADYPITFDNQMFFNYRINEQNLILVVNSQTNNRYFEALYQNNASFTLEQTTFGKVKTSEFSKYQLIILDEPENIPTGLIDELKKYVGMGGALVLLPGKKTEQASLNKLLQSLNAQQISGLEIQNGGIEKINFQHFVYKDVFSKPDEKLNLPSFNSYFTIPKTVSAGFSELLTSKTGKPLLYMQNFEKGHVYVFLFSLKPENSDFAVHQLFVPTFYNIAAFSLGLENIYYKIGQDNNIELNIKQTHADKPFHIINKEQTVDFIPYQTGIGEKGIRLDLKQNIRIADNYFLTSGEDILKCISLNYNRRESETDFYSNKEILELIERHKRSDFQILPANMDALQHSMKDLHKDRKDFWKIFIILALIAIVGEILVIRLWSDKRKAT